MPESGSGFIYELLSYIHYTIYIQSDKTKYKLKKGEKANCRIDQLNLSNGPFKLFKIKEKVKENFCSLQVKIKFGSGSASNCSESATLVYHLQELVEQYSSVVSKPKAADAAVLSSNSDILP